MAPSTPSSLTNTPVSRGTLLGSGLLPLNPGSVVHSIADGLSQPSPHLSLHSAPTTLPTVKIPLPDHHSLTLQAPPVVTTVLSNVATVASKGSSVISHAVSKEESVLKSAGSTLVSDLSKGLPTFSPLTDTPHVTQLPPLPLPSSYSLHSPPLLSSPLLPSLPLSSLVPLPSSPPLPSLPLSSLVPLPSSPPLPSLPLSSLVPLPSSPPLPSLPLSSLVPLPSSPPLPSLPLSSLVPLPSSLPLPSLPSLSLSLLLPSSLPSIPLPSLSLSLSPPSSLPSLLLPSLSLSLSPPSSLPSLPLPSLSLSLSSPSSLPSLPLPLSLPSPSFHSSPLLLTSILLSSSFPPITSVQNTTYPPSPTTNLSPLPLLPTSVHTSIPIPPNPASILTPTQPTPPLSASLSTNLPATPPSVGLSFPNSSPTIVPSLPSEILAHSTSANPTELPIALSSSLQLGSTVDSTSGPILDSTWGPTLGSTMNSKLGSTMNSTLGSTASTSNPTLASSFGSNSPNHPGATGSQGAHDPNATSTSTQHGSDQSPGFFQQQPRVVGVFTAVGVVVVAAAVGFLILSRLRRGPRRGSHRIPSYDPDEEEATGGMRERGLRTTTSRSGISVQSTQPSLEDIRPENPFATMSNPMISNYQALDTSETARSSWHMIPTSGLPTSPVDPVDPYGWPATMSEADRNSPRPVVSPDPYSTDPDIRAAMGWCLADEPVLGTILEDDDSDSLVTVGYGTRLATTATGSRTSTVAHG